MAVESVLLNNFDLIFMDIQMPVMGGVEAVQLMRNAGVDCPVVALTANVMKEDIDTYLQSGFDKTLAKPIQNHLFHQTLNHYLGRPKSEEDIQLEQLVENLKSGDEFKQLQQNFRQRMPQLIVDFQQALADENWSQLKQLSHAVKGSAGSMGYDALTELGAKIEALLQSNDLQEAALLTHEFVKVCQQLVEQE